MAIFSRVLRHAGRLATARVSARAVDNGGFGLCFLWHFYV